MSGDQIVALQRAPQPSSLYSDYGIVLPEPFAPLEHFDGNRVALDALGAAGKRFLRDIGKEGSASTYLRKFMTAKDMFELRANLVLVRWSTRQTRRCIARRWRMVLHGLLLTRS
ncbi:hypothetical protein [Rhizobium leguminosarum]|uniref:hypothetical protein n=1 Tax=Rhizobium leguminosarum TaxID=384 RepID=UPI001FDA2034|nr:hypothetical protein [Rhizobium leguminosarum]